MQSIAGVFVVLHGVVFVVLFVCLSVSIYIFYFSVEYSMSWCFGVVYHENSFCLLSSDIVSYPTYHRYNLVRSVFPQGAKLTLAILERISRSYDTFHPFPPRPR